MLSRARFKPRTLAAAFIATGLAAALVACGGGGGGGTVTSNAQGLTSIYFTDDFSALYDAVWVSATRVTVVSPTGEVQVAAFNPEKLINLPTLRRSGALVATAAIPANATSVRVYVGPTARLQNLDGSLVDVALSAPGGFIEFKLEGWNSVSGALALDFDLPRFTLSGNTLMPAVRLATNDDFASWNQRYTEVVGTVTAVSVSSLTLETSSLGSRTIALDSNTSFYADRLPEWTPSIGNKVEVYAAITGTTAQGLQFTARSVKVKSDNGNGDTSSVKGTVASINGTQVVVNIQRSNSSIAVGALTIDISNALFKRGSVSILTPGMRIEAHIAMAGANWSASTIEIEGAARHEEPSQGSSQDSYAQAKGKVVGVSGSKATIAIVYVKGILGIANGSELTIDVANAYFEKGDLRCLAPGVPVEVKGYLNANGALQPVEVEVNSGCAGASPVSDDYRPSSSPVSTGPRFVEASGTVTAVRAGEFDLNVYRIEDSSTVNPTVTVRHDSATVFKRSSATSIALGAFVEIKGSLNGTVLAAAKVELE